MKYFLLPVLLTSFLSHAQQQQYRFTGENVYYVVHIPDFRIDTLTLRDAYLGYFTETGDFYFLTKKRRHLRLYKQSPDQDQLISKIKWQGDKKIDSFWVDQQNLNLLVADNDNRGLYRYGLEKKPSQTSYIQYHEHAGDTVEFRLKTIAEGQFYQQVIIGDKVVADLIYPLEDIAISANGETGVLKESGEEHFIISDFDPRGPRDLKNLITDEDSMNLNIIHNQGALIDNSSPLVYFYKADEFQVSVYSYHLINRTFQHEDDYAGQGKNIYFIQDMDDLVPILFTREQDGVVIYWLGKRYFLTIY